MDLFLYGTLLHPPLLELVLGRAAPDGQPTNLPGARAIFAPDGSYPVLLFGGASPLAGVVLSDLSETDIARLDYYERVFGYSLTEVTLTDASQAGVYTAEQPAALDGPDWDLAAWAAKWGALSVEAAREVMGFYGKLPPEDVARIFPAIRKRAVARVLAQSPRYLGDTFQGAHHIHQRDAAYAKFFRLDDLTLSHETFQGEMTGPLKRAVFVGMDAALVLPYDPVRDRVLLVEQFRLGPFGRQDPAAWQLEPIAGHIDPGETPEEAARREAREEAGLTLTSLHPIAESYASPGESTSFFHLFLGLAELPDDAARIGGLASEGENIRARLFSFDAFMTMAEERRATNMPTVAAAYWLAHHRERLRALSP